ncbi:MAG: hypothetical protein OXP70_12305, partial [Acidobacteriota bacterium]|nr:hypothetical protein [Acidobacteriota bacterium]
EAAYRRTDLFERRRALMEQWAAFLTGAGTLAAAESVSHPNRDRGATGGSNEPPEPPAALDR